MTATSPSRRWIGEYVSLAFVRESVNGRRVLLAGDFRSPAESSYTYDFLVRGNVNSDVSLHATVEGGMPPGASIVLFDPSRHRRIDLRATPVVVLSRRPTEDGARYKLLVNVAGDPQFPDATAPDLPRSFALAQNYPNPFNGSTAIGFDIASSVAVKISIFDVLGGTVRILTNREYAQGRYSVSWDGQDGQGRRAASGVYIYRLAAGDMVFSRKMVLLK